MKKKYILSIMLFAMAVAGCKKNLDQQVNPNAPSSVSPGYILSGAEVVTATRTQTDYTTFGIWLGYYAPSGNYVPVTNTETYVFTNSSFNVFNPIYSNITNYNYLVQQAAANPSLNYYGAISTIMMAYDYQMLVDNYNDVPYTQALNSSTYLFPAYDSGQSIYNSLMLSLDAAIGTINTSKTATSPASADVIFQGNMAKWKKFANTIKLRLAVRQSNIAANKAGLVTELAKTAIEGYLDDVTFATVQPGFSASDANSGEQSTFVKANGYTAAGAESAGHAQNRANSFFINYELGLGNDSLRLKQVYSFTANTTAEYVAYNALVAKNNKLTPPVTTPALASTPGDYKHIIGNTFGNDATNGTNAQVSAIGPGYIIPVVAPINPATIITYGPYASAASPAIILSGAEACYLLSEAIVEGLIPGAVSGGTGTAQDYYQRGITANFVQLAPTYLTNIKQDGTGTTIPAATAAFNYYSQPGVVDVNWAASNPVTNPLVPLPTGASSSYSPLVRAIISQKYIALFGYEILETYNEYRRTGFPNLQGARSTTGGALGTGPVPNRIYFPLTETQTNLTSVSAEPTIDPFKSKIFWAL